MSRNTLGYALVALLGVVAVAFTATRFRTPGQQQEPGIGSESGSGSSFTAVPDEPPVVWFDFHFYLGEILTALMVAFVVGGLYYVSKNWRAAAQTVVATLVIVGAMVAVVRLEWTPFWEDDADAESEEIERDAGAGGGENGNASAIDGPGMDGGGEPLPLEVTLLIAVLTLLLMFVLAVGVLLVHRRLIAESSTDESANEPSRTATPGAVGRAAGRAADRLEHATDADNEIYRAWAEMAGLVDISDPETKTTAEFADAAVDAGMEREDVRELTRLFESVRYGTDEPGERDEQRAIDLFRRIESTYTEAES